MIINSDISTLISHVQIDLASSTYSNNIDSIYTTIKKIQKTIINEVKEDSLDTHLAALESLELEMEAQIPLYENTKVKRAFAKAKAKAASIPFAGYKNGVFEVSKEFIPQVYSHAIRALSYHQERVGREDQKVDNLFVFLDQQKVFEIIVPENKKQRSKSINILGHEVTETTLNLALNHQNKISNEVLAILENEKLLNYYSAFNKTAKLKFIASNTIEKGHKYGSLLKSPKSKLEAKIETTNKQHSLIQTHQKIKELPQIEYSPAKIVFDSARILDMIWSGQNISSDKVNLSFYDIYLLESNARKAFMSNFQRLPQKIKNNHYLLGTRKRIKNS